MSRNLAYANIEYEKGFRSPADPLLVEYVKRIGYPDTEILAAIDAVNGTTPTTTAGQSATSSPTASVFSDCDGVPDTPITPEFLNDFVAMVLKSRTKTSMHSKLALISPTLSTTLHTVPTAVCLSSRQLVHPHRHTV